MGRVRMIKPGFFTNDEIGGLEPLARLLFIGLWTAADREGRIEDRPRRIKAELLPYDDCDVSGLLDSLERAGLVARYEADGVAVIQVVNFVKHQHPHHKEVPSTLPPQAGNGRAQVNLEPSLKQARAKLGSSLSQASPINPSDTDTDPCPDTHTHTHPKLEASLPETRVCVLAPAAPENLSRFSMTDWRRYSSAQPGVRNPEGLARSLARSGEADDLMESFLASERRPKESDEERRLRLAAHYHHSKVQLDH